MAISLGGEVLAALAKEARMPVDTAPELRFEVAKKELAGLTGADLAASLVKYLRLAEAPSGEA